MKNWPKLAFAIPATRVKCYVLEEGESKSTALSFYIMLALNQIKTQKGLFQSNFARTDEFTRISSWKLESFQPRDNFLIFT